MSQLRLLPSSPVTAAQKRAEDERKAATSRAMCACGHETLHHDAKGRCRYGHGTRFGGCKCKRRKARGRLVVVAPPSVEAPAAAVVLMRTDLKRPKVAGWALAGPAHLVAYLEQLKTTSPNAFPHPNPTHVDGTPKARGFAQHYAIANAQIAQKKDRARSAIEQAKKAFALPRGLPLKIVITRVVASRGLDSHDNLASALKAVTDGVCLALGFDDQHLSPEGRDATKIAVHYRNAKPGRRKVRGVRIELFWMRTP